MPSQKISESSRLRKMICNAYICNEIEAVQALIDYLALDEVEGSHMEDEAAELVRVLRRSKNPGLMETFLSEYGLSTEEGVALMCLAEALLRVPDEDTIDVLIRDKISAGDWSKHLGHSTSPLVNASTWALMLTGKVISPQETESWDVVRNIRFFVRRAGEPVVRRAVAQSMKILGHQFVLGRNIDEAVDRAAGMEKKGYQYSYDMLGEGAYTAEDAKKYFLSYSRAISRLSEQPMSSDIRDNPGISVKLSALHPRYEFGQKERVLVELVPRVASLVLQAKNAQMGFNIDAEEADRLDLSLDVIEAVLSEPDLAGWDGFGVVVQAYGPRAFTVLDWCYDLATRLDRKIMVRLVKGAYWDTEIKLAQVEGLAGYPVFTRKAATDISYMACAKKLLSMTDRIYPQFATHNAHSIATIVALAGSSRDFEFQRLHGMGEALHSLAMERYETRCRIYAPVGVHEDLLAYLVRRLLENGANSSFVNQVLDEKVPARQVVLDPVKHYRKLTQQGGKALPMPTDIYPFGRVNSKGFNFANPTDLTTFCAEQETYQQQNWRAMPIICGINCSGQSHPVINPAKLTDEVGRVTHSEIGDILTARDACLSAQPEWAKRSVTERAGILRQYANLLEENRAELMAILIREAGKTPLDALGEVREAIDFCRYYADEAGQVAAGNARSALGTFICISPWNFPLAIFTGQIVAALVTGNAVLAKPADQTPLIAAAAVKLMHKAGFPDTVLHLLTGDGKIVGNKLVSLPDISGVCFTGSTQTARHINRSMAGVGNYEAPFIAETGGLNAMIVDSTALPEQAVRDIVASAFQSAGQRCSALRILYVQEEVAERIIDMLKGAMGELVVGDPAYFRTDAGPVIDAAARAKIDAYCQKMEEEGRLIKRLELSDEVRESGYFVSPTLLSVSGIEEMSEEIFGPVLHVATYPSGGIEQVVSAINASGYGLTMGLHTRVDGRVQKVADLASVGNLYVNRNQIGAVVGLQPFGGKGLSGTGPKAGGPLYLHKFVGVKSSKPNGNISPVIDVLPETAIWLKDCLSALMDQGEVDRDQILARLSGYSLKAIKFNGPTGESNQLEFQPRGRLLIMGQNWLSDSLVCLATGNSVYLPDHEKNVKLFKKIVVTTGIPADRIILFKQQELKAFLTVEEAVEGSCLSIGKIEITKNIRDLLVLLPGPIVPNLKSGKSWREFVEEQTLSIDTTASGGNAALLASIEG